MAKAMSLYICEISQDTDNINITFMAGFKGRLALYKGWLNIGFMQAFRPKIIYLM